VANDDFEYIKGHEMLIADVGEDKKVTRNPREVASFTE